MSDDTLQERNGFRVRLVLDESPDEPYDDGQSPILHMYYANGWHAKHVDPGTHRPRDCDARIAEAAEHFGHDFDKLERYLRAFHGVTCVDSFATRDNEHYLTYDDKAWRDKVGAPAGSASIEEWRAYVEGDVFGYVIEQHVSWTANDAALADYDDYLHLDSLWGFYGDTYAKEAANEAFQSLMDGPHEYDAHTWANGFGNWHVRVERQSPVGEAEERSAALAALVAEISVRDAHADMTALEIRQVSRTSEHGTVSTVYVEHWPSEDDDD